MLYSSDIDPPLWKVTLVVFLFFCLPICTALLIGELSDNRRHLRCQEIIKQGMPQEYFEKLCLNDGEKK